MNKTKIEWCDYTWNPITGCLHGCNYCYAEKLAKRFTGHFKPTFHEDRFKPNKLVGKNIFVCSMADLFGEWVPPIWIEKVIEYIQNDMKNNYFFLTKNPKRYKNYCFPKNCYAGFSASTQNDFDDRYNNRCDFVSIEPIQEAIDIEMHLLDWVIVGAETGNRKNKIIHEKKWIDDIVARCSENGIPLFIKDNIKYPEKIQEHEKIIKGGK
jgi:protein gp37